ncbi:MAG: outer membrane lipoprotein-sorting protein [Chitinophagaceae bacterium]|jgi:outer membrane lipoprotein-sorting protein|nr:outer membrane lipoprotein-sorting protein [Chitinophagaceae bacterium]MCA6482695.1 outer membrane lipoprotein-sorting protein [Chitinophagaceae bacterium]MCA6496003.1 outer membrane lipoprotein-sorting protein [Chitinophagaceae bacterium]MCA6500942.1 outer membrane lipoprotein-sorting protein [Chitinophagaceae bacterium]MCA6515899.1 outer membrane lipoprotein-sorting protein [Chitinophagaceae bacterium]
MKYLLLFLLTPLFLPSLQQPSAGDVVKKADEKMRGTTSQVQMVIKTTRPTWTREMQVKAWMANGDYALILIQSPARDKGIVFLKRGKEVWNWMPTLERTIKLPPSMMSQSWMGTDFTNDDLVKESSLVKDYVHRFIGDTLIDGRPCYKIESIPKPTTAVVWSKLLVCIDKKDYLELYTEFYDENGELINLMRANNIKMMDGRLIPTHFEMIPMDKKNQKTELIYNNILFNRPIDSKQFTIENMKRIN